MRMTLGSIVLALAAALGAPDAGEAGSPAVPAALDWHILATVDTLDLYLNGSVVGSMIQATVVDDAERKIEVNTGITVESDGRGAGPAFTTNETRSFDFEGKLRSVLQEIVSPAGRSAWSLANEPGNARITVTAGGVSTPKEIPPVKESVYHMFRLLTAAKNGSLKAGDTLRDTSFELMSGQEVFSTIVCQSIPSPGRGSWVFSIYNTLTRRSERWEMDKRFKTIYRDISPYFVARPHSAGTGARSAGDIFTNVYTVFNVPASNPPSSGERVALRFGDSLIPDGSILPLYTAQGKDWILTGVRRECAGRDLPGQWPDSLQPYLKPTVTMQSDDPQIEALAKRIVGNERRCCIIIQKLTDYVFGHLEKRNTATFSNAIETLKAGFGDCGEHAVLLGALLRSAGIPAHVVVGLVFAPGKGYLYHAWVMAFSGDWVFTDAALGVFPAPNNRIPLLIDDTGSGMAALAKYIGRIAVKYVADPAAN